MTDPAPPSPDTYLAVGELVQAAAHAQGLTGPVQYTVLSEPPASADGHSDGSLLNRKPSA